jgi:C1A family cysteine protease
MSAEPRRRKLIPVAKFLTRRNHYKLKRKMGYKISFGVANLPSSVDLRDKFGNVYDQGDIGSCTANAMAGAYRMMSAKRFEGSRLFLYCQERLLENPGQPLQDNGAYPKDGFNFLETNGMCSEASYPYDTSKVNDVPPEALMSEAKCHKTKDTFDIDTTKGVQTIQEIEHSLATGIPLCIGVAVYQSFMSDTVAQTGQIPMPNPQNFDNENDSQDPILGGHELLVIGYDHVAEKFLIANSWGSGWGLAGFCWMPYSYVLNGHLCQECTGFTQVIETLPAPQKTVDECLSSLFTKLIQVGKEPTGLISAAQEFILNLQGS